MEKKEEATLTHDGKTYKVSELNEDARKQFLNVQVADGEIKRLKMQLALAQTALSAYEQALVQQLPKE